MASTSSAAAAAPSWALSGRDPTAVKQDIERRLEAEERKVAEVDAIMKASGEITSDMVGILASFEQRLKRLEGTILPVYQETENLQRRQASVQQSVLQQYLSQLDHYVDSLSTHAQPAYPLRQF